jgi:hypothetical protein
LAYIQLTGKKKLESDLAQQRVRVKQAQDELNRTVNGKPLYEVNKAAYEAADIKFKEAVAKRDAIQTSIDNFVEPVKPKSKKELEQERQRNILEGKVPPTGGTISGEPGSDQVQVVDDFKSLKKSAPKFLRDLSDDERLILATQLANAGYQVPKIKAYNDALLMGYTSLIQGAEGKNKQFPNEIKTVDDFLAEQTNIANQIKAAGGGDELPKPFGQQEIYNRSTAEGVIDSIFASLNLGREASKTEIDTLYKQLQAEQKKLSSISKGTYKMVNGRRVLVQESGLDARTFLENKVKELPAYKESQAAKSEKTKNTLAATALANGYNLETDFALQLPGWLEAVNNGKSIDEFQNVIRANARRSLPEAVRNQIPPTEDLGTTFSTYLSKWSKSRGLPINYANLSKVIPLAYNDKGFATDKEFTIANRSQPDWEGGPEAIDIYSRLVNDTLKDFGMIGQGVRTV